MMKASLVCDECGKKCSFIEYEHQGAITQKSICSACRWFHIVVDGEEVYRGVEKKASPTPEDVYEKGIKQVVSYLRGWNDGWQTKVAKAATMLEQLLAQGKADQENSSTGSIKE